MEAAFAIRCVVEFDIGQGRDAPSQINAMTVTALREIIHTRLFVTYCLLFSHRFHARDRLT